MVSGSAGLIIAAWTFSDADEQITLPEFSRPAEAS